jgi:DNA-directed RNA polymerase specialized sigma24 family protein
VENESFREILTCIRQLPETLRTIVYYRYVVDLTAKQVSLLTNLRISTSIFHTPQRTTT